MSRYLILGEGEREPHCVGASSISIWKQRSSKEKPTAEQQSRLSRIRRIRSHCNIFVLKHTAKQRNASRRHHPSRTAPRARSPPVLSNLRCTWPLAKMTIASGRGINANAKCLRVRTTQTDRQTEREKWIGWWLWSNDFQFDKTPREQQRKQQQVKMGMCTKQEQT